MGTDNVLRDGGSYSYVDPTWNHYFSGTSSHNTVQFDDRDQMPRLSRFLFGSWLQTTELSPPLQHNCGRSNCAASYRDWQKVYYRREISLEENRLVVEDRIKGFRNRRYYVGV